MADPDEAEGSRGDGGSAGAQIRTFLIADVRGYTLFTQERGDEAAAKLAARFADLAREGVEARGGTLLELRGDEALCVFASAREAIRTAVDLQQRFVEETLDDPELPLTVGIGLDAGEAVAVQGGYRGGALNLAARLCGQARAGEILASREVTHLARKLDGVRYEDRGQLTFKGIADPVAVVRVAPEGADPVDRLQPFAPPPSERKPTKRWPVVAGVGALIVALIAIPLLGSGGGEPATVASNSVARLDAGDGRVDLSTPLGERPGASAIGFGSLWVAQPDRGVVARVDLGDGAVTDTIRVGTSPAGLAVGLGSVWVTNSAEGTVSRISVDTNEVSQELPAGTGPTGIAFGDGALWIADTIGAALIRLDPTSGESASVPLSGQPSGVAFTADGVWVSVAPNAVVRLDPASLSVTLSQTVGNGPSAVVPAFGSIWVTNHLDGTIARVDPSTGRIEALVPVGEGPNALAASEGSLWVAHGFDDTIVAIDPTANAGARPIDVGGSAASLAIDGSDLWLAVGASAGSHRGGTLTVSTEAVMPASIDPALAYDFNLWSILTITNDGLLAFKKVGGPDGATLVPDLASSLPEISADGLSYRFPLREGVRYSSGDPVRPADFRYGLERTISLSTDAAGLFRAIDGVRDCADVDVCDLSDSIVVDEGSVTFRLARPDPDLPFKLALPFAYPVPASTPIRDQGLDPVPATGPYMIAEAGGDRIELVRNPAFREWSGAAQPDGFVDAISMRFEADVASAFDRLDAGELDVMIDEPGPEDLAILASAHPDQVVVWPGTSTLFVGFDVQKPPFDDRLVRRAVNFAIDRGHAADLLGGSASQRPTCQILPPNFQGYVPYCPYTLDPESGVWLAPDPDRAQALIEEAGAVGMPVTVWVTDAPGYLPAGGAETMRYVADVLDEIGLRARFEIVADGDAYFGELYGAPAGTSSRPHVFMSGWIQDFPAASNFIDPQFRCGSFGNPSGWCSEELDARIDEAQRLPVDDPGAIGRAWSDIEHGLVDDGVQAPLTNPITTQAISARTENVQINPQWGMLLSLIWVQ